MLLVGLLAFIRIEVRLYVDVTKDLLGFYNEFSKIMLRSSRCY